MNAPGTSRITPWVGRLMVANATVLLLLLTVFTAPEVQAWLRFDPAGVLGRPWVFLSYMFVHSGPVHLGLNLLVLAGFGPRVERRMGGGGFLLFYLYCGVGAAAFALGLSSFLEVRPFVGASGALLGVALAFALAWPEDELSLFPIPLRIPAKTLVLTLATADLLGALLFPQGGIAHLAHLGGLAAGYACFRIQSLTERRTRRNTRPAVRRPAMLAPISLRSAQPAELGSAPGPEPAEEEGPADELNRLLDKISAFGLGSLTSEERRFLDEAAKKKRSDLH